MKLAVQFLQSNSEDKLDLSPNYEEPFNPRPKVGPLSDAGSQCEAQLREKKSEYEVDTDSMEPVHNEGFGPYVELEHTTIALYDDIQELKQDAK